MKIVKEFIGYIITILLVVLYIGAIGNGDIFLAKIFSVILYVLPLVLIFRNQLSKLKLLEKINKVDNYITLKRIKITIPAIFTVLAIIAVFKENITYFGVWYQDLIISLVSIWLFSALMILLIHFFFSDKIIFNNDKKTDEFITVLTGIMFLGMSIIIFIKPISISLFTIIYIGLIINFILFIYKVLEAVVSFNKSSINFLGITKSITLIIILMLSIIYIQNILVYRQFSNAYSGVNLNEYFDIFYYSVTNLTSVGFGDIVPNNIYAKIISIETSIFGYILFITLFGLFISKISEGNIK
ncbi:ion channel [Candidatus Izemoplasma sp. B36]|uniref:ion channel n=1 Tax=Candidatus Izemoplasma sp. B36 TaxID=3242468 RepID=UPI00355635AE